ncbi:MAG: SpoIIE family protein phosphatase [Thermovenabulum sp.]|uniref:SpoIIE family protein phosphatase n=1 Tax=Thermovenabulum sp. TaxID=3100335 RepID=UPI003C7A5D8C
MINKKALQIKRAEVRKNSISLKEVMIFFISFFIGHASFFNIYPFGISFVASMVSKEKNKIFLVFPAFIGTLIGVKNFNLLLKYFFAYIIFTALYLVLQKEVYNKKWLLPLICFISIIFGGIFSFIYMPPSYYDFIMLLLESLLSYITALILSEGLKSFFYGCSENVEKIITVAIIFGSLLDLLGEISFFGILAKTFVISIIIIFSALMQGSTGALSYGVFLSLLAYPSSVLPWAISFYSISGSLASSFKKFGKIAVFIGFLIGYIIYYYYISPKSMNLLNYPSIILIFIITVLTPDSFIKRIERVISIEEKDDMDYSLLKENVKNQLIELANTVEEMGKIYKIPMMDCKLNPLEESLMKIKNRVCNGCALSKACWERDYKYTISDIYKLYTLKENSMYNELPRLFKARCGKFEDIYKIVKTEKEKSELKNILDLMVNDTLNTAFEKVKYFSDAIRMLSENALDENIYAEELKKGLLEQGVKVENIFITDTNEGHDCFIIKRPCVGERPCEVSIRPFFERNFIKGAKVLKVDCPLNSGGEKCRIKVVPQSILSVAVGYVNLPKEGASFSGDSSSFFESKSGKYYLALSDGMGVGEKAKNHSEKTLIVLENILEAGYSIEQALPILNRAMQVYGAGTESFSTLDLAFIDLFTGITEFIKAGAVASFIKRKDKVEVIKGSALPIGVVDGISPFRIKKKLMPQDMVILVTDGVIDSIKGNGDKEEKFIKIIENIKTNNPQEFAEKILKKVLEGCEEKRDDMAVLVGLVWERKN